MLLVPSVDGEYCVSKFKVFNFSTPRLMFPQYIASFDSLHDTSSIPKLVTDPLLEGTGLLYLPTFNFINMPMEALGLFSLVLFFVLRFASSDINFAHNGFLQANLSLDGASCVRSDGILAVTNGSSKIFGHAFHPSPLQFTEKSHKNNFSIATFSTNFVFSIIPKYPDIGGHGLAFVLMSTKEPKGCLPNQYLGLPNDTSNQIFSSRILAVEFDIAQNLELEDINDNHVGIDVSSLISNVSEPAAYFFSSKSSKNSNNSINLKSGDPIQAWVDYHSKEKLLNVSISPLGMPRPYRPLISFPVDLSLVLDDYMYAGFSASTGLLTAEHNVHGWSFRIGGRAEDLDQTRLPFIGSSSSTEVQYKKSFAVGITLASITLVIFVTSAVVHVLRRIRNDDEDLEDWEVEYGTRRFKYSELHRTTRGFGARNLIGSGGFGKVYRGVISSTGLEVAIKWVAHDSRQGMKEFVAEITSMGRLRHRNLVQLHGWCRKQDELLLIYEYVPNGSLDKLLTEDDSQKKKLLTWGRRYRILTGVAQALLYLHEECDQQVVHRDVKPSNVLIDADLNPKLGDFGLVRIYEHGINTQTTHIVGTLGYMAPEVTRTGKATTSTDVYGYGILMLEVACGRRPIDPQKNAAELVLVDWVRELHSRADITTAIDPNLDGYDKDEVELVLTLGLLCSHPHPDHRPSMRRIVQFLLGDASLPSVPLDIHNEVHGVVIEYPGTCTEDSDPSSCGMSPSLSTSFTSFDKKGFC